ncbi:MAG TPA: hypothetical protein VI685_15555 [Candidatus Angelobacter sp.]
MKPAAIGVRVHSGWGALVAVAGTPGAEEIIERTRIEITDPKMPGAVQPYHFVQSMDMRRAEQHIAKCAAACSQLALEAIRELLEQLQTRGYQIARSCILLSSGRPLPELAGILASHALIHTAEGEFFRNSFRDAFETLRIPVTGIRERDLPDQAQKRFGKAAAKVQERLAAMGRSLGPPWTTDQKTAALAALIVLHQDAAEGGCSTLLID